MQTLLYFAYGSNLDEDQMRSRCPTARLQGPASLEHYELGFVGMSAGWGGAVATVVSRREARVMGVLYQMTHDDFAALDRFEGHPRVYERRVLPVISMSGPSHAHVYIRPEGSAERGVPSDRYFDLIARAYSRHDFDAAPLLRAAGR